MPPPRALWDVTSQVLGFKEAMPGSRGERERKSSKQKELTAESGDDEWVLNNPVIDYIRCQAALDVLSSIVCSVLCYVTCLGKGYLVLAPWLISTHGPGLFSCTFDPEENAKGRGKIVVDGRSYDEASDSWSGLRRLWRLWRLSEAESLERDFVDGLISEKSLKEACIEKLSLCRLSSRSLPGKSKWMKHSCNA